MSHFLLLCLHALLVGVFFAYLTREENRGRARVFGMVAGGMILGALVLAWMMYPFPIFLRCRLRTLSRVALSTRLDYKGDREYGYCVFGRGCRQERQQTDRDHHPLDRNSAHFVSSKPEVEFRFREGQIPGIRRDGW